MKKTITTALLALNIFCHAQTGIGTASPDSMLDIRGSFSTNYRSFTAATTAGLTDNLLVFTGGYAATNERWQVAGGGFTGIGNNNPSETLQTER